MLGGKKVVVYLTAGTLGVAIAFCQEVGPLAGVGAGDPAIRATVKDFLTGFSPCGLGLKLPASQAPDYDAPVSRGPIQGHPSSVAAITAKGGVSAVLLGTLVDPTPHRVVPLTLRSF